MRGATTVHLKINRACSFHRQGGMAASHLLSSWQVTKSENVVPLLGQHASRDVCEFVCLLITSR
jgi:hypothetical protein